jgi:hypothetical protein
VSIKQNHIRLRLLFFFLVYKPLSPSFSTPPGFVTGVSASASAFAFFSSDDSVVGAFVIGADGDSEGRVRLAFRGGFSEGEGFEGVNEGDILRRFEARDGRARFEERESLAGLARGVCLDRVVGRVDGAG